MTNLPRIPTVYGSLMAKGLKRFHISSAKMKLTLFNIIATIAFTVNFHLHAPCIIQYTMHSLSLFR